jgi:succinyl-CoA synthetase alpha subunit
MSVLINRHTRVVVQGLTGRQASWSGDDMRAYGTRVVAGVVPGKGGQEHHGVPLFDRVSDAIRSTNANAAVTYVPPQAAAGAISEALEAGVPLVIYPGDGLPVHDALHVRRLSRRVGGLVVGPNTPGVITPGESKLGFMPSYCFVAGDLGVVSKSGSLSYEVCWRLTQAGIGQSTVIGIGGDPIKGMTMGEALALLHADPKTTSILVLGEVGGVDEYDACVYAQGADPKPLGAFLVGRTAPSGRKLGHAGALIDSERAGYTAKVRALERLGIPVAHSLAELVGITRQLAGEVKSGDR